MTDIIKRSCILLPMEDYSVLSGREDELISKVISSGVTGRGYAGLPAGERWKSFGAKDGQRELVCLISGICADTLMEANPEAVWAGAALTAKAFGIEYVWMVSDCGCTIPAEYFSVNFRAVRIDHTLSAGEETLVFAKIEDRIPITSPQPPYPVERGLFGNPTLIHSAEFFAHLPYLITETDKNTKLTFISGDVENSGVFELETGISFAGCAELAGVKDFRAVRIGGVNGQIIPAEKGGRLDYAYCRENGIVFGDGSLFYMGGRRCMARELYLSLGEAYRSSCGRCVFCREGLYQMYLLLEDIVKGKATDGTVALIRDVASVIEENAGCDYGRMTARAVSEGLKDFYDEIEGHTRGKCRALCCPGMYTAHILPDRCTGCGRCADICPNGCIAGGEGLIHVIDQSRCDQCGKCFACPVEAVAGAGAVKPACPDSPIPVGTFVQKKKGLQRRTLK